MHNRYLLPILSLSVLISIYIHTQSWDGVFTSWGIRLSGNDPWYYLRLIEYTVSNFPNRIYYDTFTNYPHGTYVHFGSFVVYLTSILTLITNQPAIVVSAFVPVIASALLPLAVYLFATSTFNERVGVLSALLIAIIPGQLLNRGSLGFNDHHIWEVFFMTLTLGLFMYSIRISNNRKLWIIYSTLTGISLWLYFVTWSPAFWLVILITVVVFIIRFDDMILQTDHSKTYINTAIIMLSVCTVLYLPLSFIYPHFSATRYSPLQLLVLVSSLVSLLILTRYIRTKKQFVTYVALIITILAIVSITFPSLYTGIPRLYRHGGGLTIAEAQPFFMMTGQFSLYPAYLNFALTFFFAILAYFILLYRIINRDMDSFLPLIWGMVLYIALISQNRWAYYYGVVCAVYTSLVLDVILTRYKFYEHLHNLVTGYRHKISYSSIVLCILLIIVVFYPTYTVAYEQSKASGPLNYAWYESLTWMRNNTPNKDLYEKLYYFSTTDTHLNNTYGVMSWWDYGHWITAIAHRIPNANPFQQGIGGGSNPGASTFLLSTTEDDAIRISDELGTKYVITDIEMTMGKFHAIVAWAYDSVSAVNKYFIGAGYVHINSQGELAIAMNKYQIPPNSKFIAQSLIPNDNYYKTMLIRLHLLDAYNLRHYRLIFESDPISPNNYMGFQEILYKLIYNNVYNSNIDISGTSGYVKIFEQVKGATITGYTDSNEVMIKTTIKTNKGRIFTYQQTTKPINGTYTFIVPYTQDTTYPVKAITPYTIYEYVNNTYIQVANINISDTDVIDGNIIYVER